MGVIGRFSKYVAMRLFELTVVFLLVVYMPGLPPEGSFTANSIQSPKPLEGPYTLNNYLNNADHLYVDKLQGPECFAEWKGELYASVHGGEVVKLLPNGEVKHITKIGQPCDGYWQEPKCGRPLGIEFDKSGVLYISDAYYGVWKVNIANDQKQLLISPTVEIEGRKPRLFNSIALAANGDFYWTDSSSDITLQDGVFGMLLDGSGRLFHYDAAKNKSRVLLDGLWFANGVALSPNEEFVIVSETARSQIRRYYLKGEKKGTDDIFIDGLPGVPDNLKACPKAILVPLVAPRDDMHPVIFQSIAPHPTLRKFLARILALIELPFKLCQNIIPHYVFERAIHWIGHFESVQALVPKRTTIVKVDWSGNVLETWHNIDSTLSGISEAYIFQHQLYLGSPYNKYVGRVPVPGVNIENVNMEMPMVKPVAQKPTEAPTTQSPKTTQPPAKQTQPPKPTQAPKPAQAAPSTPKPTQAPPPKTTQAPPPKTTQAPPPKTAKPAEKATPPPKKATEKPAKAEKPEIKAKPIPIREEIPADTAPPKKENLKIIRKEGPSEIPNPDVTEKAAPSKTVKKEAPSKNEL